ncbi:DUF3710 domain-containing protein [Janibacter terrae]|uniref:DUF3710 domain-containing protein n=1 Tax=Janibacter terrae TaxID=103817 RepID=A0ABZ2FCV4_9MICO
MFGRKKRTADADVASTEQDTTTQTATTSEPGSSSQPRTAGPHDISDVADTSTRVDLGALRLTPAPGTELRLEVDQKNDEVSAAQVGDDHGAVQLQVFAAPRSFGIWDEIRGEIAEMIGGNGGTVEEVTGPFGTELRARLAQPGPQGRTVFAPVVFAGVDGPRWFLRAVYSGAAAVDESARAGLDEVVRSVVVDRGEEPRAPREMLPLTMPSTQRSARPAADEPADAPAEDDLKPFERGPEITEVR